jgi:hypothetical protein
MWYGGDFGPNPPAGVFTFIKPYLSALKEQQLVQVTAGGPSTYTVHYSNYDWSLNGS